MKHDSLDLKDTTKKVYYVKVEFTVFTVKLEKHTSYGMLKIRTNGDDEAELLGMKYPIGEYEFLTRI